MDQCNKLSPQTCLFLSHHGILGQKWGQRNGPPYPLKASAHSSSENKAGWQKSLDKSSKTNDNSSGSTKAGSSTTTAIAAVIATMSAVEIGAIVANNVRAKSRIKKGQKLVEQFEKENAEDSTTPRSISSKDINPLNSNMNCGACCMAEELRLRGQSVAAKDFNGMTTLQMMDYFEEVPKGNSAKLSTDAIIPGDGKKTQAGLANELAKTYPEGSRGCLYVPMWFGNHYITWENKNGSVEFRNPQNSSLDLTSKCFANAVKSGTVGSDTVGIWSIRWDNLTFKNDTIGEVLYGGKDSLSKTINDQYGNLTSEQYQEAQRKRMNGG